MEVKKKKKKKVKKNLQINFFLNLYKQNIHLKKTKLN